MDFITHKEVKRIAKTLLFKNWPSPLRKPGDTTERVLFINDYEKTVDRVLSFRYFPTKR